MVSRYFARDDLVRETKVKQGHPGSSRATQGLPDLRVVHKRGDAQEKAAWGGTFLGRTFYGLPQEAGERLAKGPRREECFGCESALPLCIRPQDTHEYRALVPENGIQARASHTHPGDEIVDRHSVVALRPEHLGRLFQRPSLIEGARSATWPGGILNH